jgi:hypothetical protein
VVDEIAKLRRDGHYNVGFERLYEAATKPSEEEALAFIRTIAEEKLTTTAVRQRNISSSASKPWNGRRLILHLKGLQKRIDLSFAETVPLDGDKHRMKEEIDNTIAVFDEAIDSLKSIKKKLL